MGKGTDSHTAQVATRSAGSRLGEDPQTGGTVAQLERRLDQLLDASLNAMAVRSQLKWREFGERYTKYFFRILNTRSSKHTLTDLKIPNSDDTVSSFQDLCRIGKAFLSKTQHTGPHRPLCYRRAPIQSPRPRDSITGRPGWPDASNRGSIVEQRAREGTRLGRIPFRALYFLAFGRRGSTAPPGHGTTPTKCQDTPVLATGLYDPSLQEGRCSGPCELAPSVPHKFGCQTIHQDPHQTPSFSTGSSYYPFQTGFVPGRKISDNGLVMAAFQEHCASKKIDG
ncbi:hypothetical protein BGZ95_007912, partial [Linnemannia exigua]